MPGPVDDDPREQSVATLRTAVRTNDLAIVEDLLDEDVQWYGTMWGGGCRSRDDVLRMLRRSLNEGIMPLLRELRRPSHDRVLLEIGLSAAEDDGDEERTVWFVLSLDAAGRIAELQDYPTAAAAEHDLTVRARAAQDGAGAEHERPEAPVSGLVPFVHVADVERSIAFYALLGFEVSDTFEPHGRPVWAALTSEGAQLMLAWASEPIDHRAQAVLFYLYARDLAGLRDHLVAHGLTPGVIVDGTPGPKQEMRVTDPDGYCLMVAQIDEDTVIAG